MAHTAAGSARLAPTQIPVSTLLARTAAAAIWFPRGVVSGLNMGEAHFQLYSSKVYAGGKKIVFHTAVTTHNGSSPNMPAGAQLSPSQTKVMVGM